MRGIPNVIHPNNPHFIEVWPDGLNWQLQWWHPSEESGFDIKNGPAIGVWRVKFKPQFIEQLNQRK